MTPSRDLERIAILGTGRLATALARLFLRSGRSVALASRDPEKAARLAATFGPASRARVRGIPLAGAAREGDLAALATRWEHTREALEAAGPFDGRILIDGTNPEAADGRSLEVGHTTSGAETIAGWAPDARVVKAFNHAYAELLDGGADFGQATPAILFCGDDAGAKARVSQLIRGCGFDPVDAGPLASARYLEPVAALFVELVRGRGRAPGDLALGILTRGQKEHSHAGTRFL